MPALFAYFGEAARWFPPTSSWRRNSPHPALYNAIYVLGVETVFTFLTRTGRLFIGVALVAAVTSIIGLSTLTTVPVASKQSAGTSSLSLVLMNSTDGLPHWGQTVTFKVSTTATSQPDVTLACRQNGTIVYSAWAGFYPSYPWPGSQDMVLSSQAWTSGGAACTATLSYVNGKKTVTLTTLNFQVYA